MIAPSSLAGVDPYDVLRSPRLPRFVRRSARLRQIVVQLRKRTPFDLSRSLGIRPFIMAKTVGCFLASVARSSYASRGLDEHGTPRDFDQETADGLIGILDSCEGAIGGGAWGYEFDVQTRWAFYPLGSANLIATVFVARGLLEAGLVFGRRDWVTRAEESADYLVAALLAPSGEYFRYTPESTTLVHNANLLGAGLVASVGAVMGRGQLVDTAVRACAASVSAQESGGWWSYGIGDALGWADNFHTAYDLDGLLHVWCASGDASIHRCMTRGVEDWTSHFFGPNGEPRYFRDSVYPQEIHSAATAVDVLSRLSVHGLDTAQSASRVEAWTRRNLVSVDGTTRFRRGRFLVDRRHFVRWGDAHWRLAEASAVCRNRHLMAPVESFLLERRGAR